LGFKNYDVKNSVIRLLLVLAITISSFSTGYSQDTTSTGYSVGRMDLPDPTSIEGLYTYDPITDRYIYTKIVGDFTITYPLILTQEEYQDLILKEQMKSYFKDKIDATDGRKENSEELQKNLIPAFYVNSGFFESVFGGNTIEIIPQGSVEIDLGLLFTKQDNPAFSPRNRKNLSFDFDQRISLSLVGKVGERLQITANYDTQSTFDFQNQIKLEYTPTEDDIIRKIEIGNVSMPLNSSLIKGAQDLFGVKTELQFGKTSITGVFSEQKSETRTVVAEGGATVNDFEIFALEYDENRHFFLSHYFRDNYDKVLSQYPFINTNVQVTRTEIWITNTTNRTDNVRNIVAIQDIGESNPENIGLPFPPGGFINAASGAYPSNSNNDFNPLGIDGSEPSILTPNIRDIATVEAGFGGLEVRDGLDYVTLENARRLGLNEYQIDTQLGYISLNQRLNNDEVLAVAFQFTVNGEVYQVGEFSSDGVDATGGTIPGEGDQEPIEGVSQNLVVKLLKSNITNVNEPIWDIMMKNIYPLGAFQLEQEGFNLNILYTDPSPQNFITPVDGESFPEPEEGEQALEQTPLLRVFNLDRLNFNGDPQQGGDGFFDFLPGITVDTQNGRIIFTNLEPFGSHLFKALDNDPNGGSEDYDIPITYNPNQEKYVFRSLYTETKTQAEQEQSDKNKFQLKGTYKSTGSDGIPIGAFNIPQGSVTVTAGGRVLVEGVDYTVNYQLGRVQILDPSLLSSNVPIQITTENNALFGQQTKRFTGINVEHFFNEKFQMGATYLNLNERPLTQKSSFDSEPINNTMFGINANYSTEVPIFTRWVNVLPNIDTDVESNISLRGEFAYLLPGAPKVSDLNGKTTSYVDDFESAQTKTDIRPPLTWFLSSTPVGLGGELGNGDLAYNYNRGKLSWYTIDPVFYSSQRPDGITVDDLSSPFTRRVFRDEIFPDQDIIEGQTQALFTLDLAFSPTQRGQYNFNPEANGGNVLPNPLERFGGITRQLTTTDFERSNVEYIEFWLMDPYHQVETVSNGGVLSFNLGNISEDVLKDGRKQYENGLPNDGGTSNTIPTAYGKVPTNQSLVYAFDTEGEERINQDIGYDGNNDISEGQLFPEFAGLEDPAEDNYQYFLQAEGNIVQRYRKYNGTEGNSPVAVGNTDRGSTSVPDVEDINRDNTMNTVDSYFEYNVNITPNMSILDNEYITDVKIEPGIVLPNNEVIEARWILFKIPISEPDQVINGASDFRSIRFMRMYLSQFEEDVVLRFGTLDLVRGDYRRFLLSLEDDGSDPDLDDTLFENLTVSVIANGDRLPIPYVIPPGVVREELNNNNNIIRQDEQSLSLRVCGLEPEDGRGVYKNFNVDMRQYKNLEMFIHNETTLNDLGNSDLTDGDMVAFIRLGNDLTQNYYEVQIPLNPTEFGATSPEEIWPIENRMLLPFDLLQKVKALVLANPDDDPFYRQSVLDPNFSGPENELTIGMIGNPSFGNVRTIMLGVKNSTTGDICGETWFNELRMTELDNEGGWAAVASMDMNFADFADVSATGRKSTVGFGSIEQGPNQRSLEDAQIYTVVSNLNLGQLLPQTWGVQLPFNFGLSEELITPKYDEEFQDIELDARLDAETNSAERDKIQEQSEDYTKRQSVNFIGVRKDRTGDAKPKIYDIENFTFSYSYNQIDHRDFEIEESLDQNARLGGTYNYNFQSKPVEPFKKNDSIFRSKYWQFLKDLNFNYLPTNISVGSNYVRQYNEQKFREFNLDDNSIGVPTLYQRNFLFDWQYTINYNLTKSLRFNFTSSNNRTVKNYIEPSGLVDNSIGIWDGFFDVGDPNRHFQSLQLNYDIPFDKVPFLKFIRATYSYTGDFQWQKSSDLFSEIEIDIDNGEPAQVYNLGNSVQNANTHRINSNFDMKNFYRYIGLTKKTVKSNSSSAKRSGADVKAGIRNNETSSSGDINAEPKLSAGDKGLNTLIGIVTMVKKIQINYQENNGTFLPGYTPSVGFIGTLKPTAGYTFGSQADVRELAARNGWLTIYPEFNEQYTEVESSQLDYNAGIELIPGLKIDLTGSRIYAENYSENYIVENGLYRSLTPSSFGNFNISTVLIKTAFSASDESNSSAFNDFRDNRFVIADRLAREMDQENPNYTYAIDDETGYPVGFGPTSQDVLLPAFLSAYKGSDASSESTSIFRDMPIPNWDLKYTGLMRINWFKKMFKRFSVQHGYRSGYTVNQFQTNLDYDSDNPLDIDQSGNYKSEIILSNVNLTEQFSPLIRLDFEMKNSVNILFELRKDRALSLSFANNILTEIKGDEIIIGAGYRVKDLRIGTNFGGKKRILKSDLNFKLDLSRRDNKTIIRYLDIDNNQTTAGQTIYGAQLSVDYALSKSLTALFYYDHTFSEYAISTAFPQTTIRTGFTLRYNFGN